MDAQIVLVPLDGSTIAEGAIPYAEAAARATGAVLRLLGVLDTRPDPMATGAAATGDSSALSRREAQEDYLHRRAKASQERGVMAMVATALGDPAEQILAAAEETDVSLVVMSTRGQSGIKRWYLGGVADVVIRTTTKPVLLVTPDSAASADRRVQLNRIVVPLDGSELAEAALPIAAELVRVGGGGMTLLHVQPEPDTTGTAPSYAADVGPAEAAGQATGLAYLKAAQRKLSDPSVADVAVLRGTPSEAIAEYVAAYPVDLLVLTAHGRGGAKHLVLGSTAHHLVRSGMPVLLLRANAAAARLRWSSAPVAGSPT